MSCKEKAAYGSDFTITMHAWSMRSLPETSQETNEESEDMVIVAQQIVAYQPLQAAIPRQNVAVVQDRRHWRRRPLYQQTQRSQHRLDKQWQKGLHAAQKQRNQLRILKNKTDKNFSQGNNIIEKKDGDAPLL